MLQEPTRLVCWFSAGAASAVATKLALMENAQRAKPLPTVVAYTVVTREHADNQRFLHDCEGWFGHRITQLRNEKYQGDPHRVFLEERYLVGPTGAKCTRLLKKEVREHFQQPNDMHVFGFTAEEQDRYDRFLDANNVHCKVPLIEHGITKLDALSTVVGNNIALPAMYALGYRNNNCIGCVKGGAGYWNKIKVDFPDVFWQMVKIEQKLNRTILKDRSGGVKRQIFLTELKPSMGRYEDEGDISCGTVCVMDDGPGLLVAD